MTDKTPEQLQADALNEGVSLMAQQLRSQHQRIEELEKALHDAATSLETISRLAGRSHYVGDGGERIPTYMGQHYEVRDYAASRAGVARALLSTTQQED